MSIKSRNSHNGIEFELCYAHSSEASHCDRADPGTSGVSPGHPIRCETPRPLDKPKRFNMQKFLKNALLVAALAASGAASAAVITFDGLTPDVFNGGDPITEGPAHMTVLGNGFSAAVINTATDQYTCFIVACPTGNASNFFVGLNDGGLSLKLDQPFRLTQLDFAFVLPVNQLVNFNVGQLQLKGLTTAGVTTTISRDFSGQDVNGNFSFSSWTVNNTFATTAFTEISFSACLFTSGGSCSSDPAVTQNMAQFALDNINVTAVPEPTTWALMGLGLAGIGAISRRRQSV